MKRVFSALKLKFEPQTLAVIEEFKRHLHADKINWVKPDNVHLTLKFFGDSTEEQIEDYIKMYSEILQNVKAFDLQIQKTGIFGSKYQPRVLWLGIQDDGSIEQIFRQQNEALKKLGIYPDRQNFVPHLTLGRIKHLHDKRRLFELVEKYREHEYQAFRVECFDLFESFLSPKGPRYNSLKAYDLL